MSARGQGGWWPVAMVTIRQGRDLGMGAFVYIGSAHGHRNLHMWESHMEIKTCVHEGEHVRLFEV